jgi:hypothetical protein
MDTIQLTATQRDQMAGLITQLGTTRQIAEAFVGYFAKELGVNLQLYHFNADVLAFEPVQGYPGGSQPPLPENFSQQVQEPSPTPTPTYSENGRIEAL